MKYLCIPGWATPPEIYSKIVPEKTLYETVDFNFFNSKEFPAAFNAKAEAILCYSLGSLFALQVAQNSNIKKIVFIGGFTFFTGHEEQTGKLRKMKINLMIRGLKKNPEKTLRDFYQEAGMPIEIPTIINVNNLIHGLELLRDCDMSHALTEIESEIVTIHAKDDKIVPVDLHKKQFNNNSRFQIEGNHGSFISDSDKLKQILTEIL